MAKYTIELRNIINIPGFNLFSFSYTRNAKAETLLPRESLQQGFIDHFYFREIAFETIEKFMYRLMTEWRENIGEFDIDLIAYGDPINVKSTSSGSTDTTSVDNDTPKNSLDILDQEGHASFIGKVKTNSKGYSGTTEVELLDKLVKHYHDVQTEFYEKFDKLFMQIF